MSKVQVGKVTPAQTPKRVVTDAHPAEAASMAVLAVVGAAVSGRDPKAANSNSNSKATATHKAAAEHFKVLRARARAERAQQQQRNANADNNNADNNDDDDESSATAMARGAADGAQRGEATTNTTIPTTIQLEQLEQLATAT